MTEQATTLQITRFFDSSPADVYSAWTEVNQLKQWHAPENVKVGEVEVNLQVGGGFKIEMLHADGDSTVATGEYLTIEKNNRLVYTWGWEGPERYDTLVTVEFVEKEGGTEMQFTHERFANSEARDKHNSGWNGCFDSLDRYIA